MPSKTIQRPKRRPPPPRAKKVHRVELRFTADEVTCLDELAAHWDVTRTEAVRLAVDRARAKHQLRHAPLPKIKKARKVAVARRAK